MPLYNVWQKACQSASTRGVPHLSRLMWLTSVCAFEVFTSSAHNVSSSGLSLIVTSEPPSGAFGFRTPTSKARLFIHPDEVSQAVREIFPASFAEVCHNVPLETVSILLLIRQQLQRIDQNFVQELRHRMRFEDLRLLKTVTCLQDQKLVRLPPVILFSTNCTTTLWFFRQRPTKRSLPEGNCCSLCTGTTL